MYRVKWINLNEGLSKLLTQLQTLSQLEIRDLDSPGQIALLYHQAVFSVSYSCMHSIRHSYCVFVSIAYLTVICDTPLAFWCAIWWFWFYAADGSAICNKQWFHIVCSTCYIKINYLVFKKWKLLIYTFNLISEPKNLLVEIVGFVYLLSLAVNCPCDFERLSD